MMDKYILKKDHLKSLLRKLGKEYRLVAPVKNRYGDTLFTTIDSLDNTAIDLDSQPQNSIKQFLFPQQEVLFNYQAASPDAYQFEPADNGARPTVYFGVRSCDLSAVLYMDVVFSRGARDPHYFDKRRQAVIIGLNCNAPFANCFCNATRSGPFLEYGSALQLTDLDSRFLVETGRAKGCELIDQWPRFFSTAEEEDVRRQYQAFLEARGGFRQLVHVDQAVKRLADGKVPDSVWSRLSLRCQDCGGCAYVCPTCTCFTITDRPLSADRGERLRSWDACTFAGFTRMAGGHNPVDHKTAAIRQRFMHKLCDDVQKHGRPSCVGCGRCVGMCFGGTDIVRFINLAGEGS